MEIVSLPLLFSLLSGVAFSLLGLSYKVANHRQCRTASYTIVFVFAAGLIALLKALTEPAAWGDWRLWVLASAMGATLYLGVLITMHCYALGPASITWTVMNLSLLIPIFLAPLLFHERLLWIDLLLGILFVLMLLAFLRGMADGTGAPAQTTGLFLLALCGLFIDNGLFILSYKVKYLLFHDANTAAVATVTYFSAGVIAVLVELLRVRRIDIRPHEWRAGIYTGAASACGLLCLLASMSLPTIVTYPISQGTSLLGGVLITALVFKERLNTFKTLGLTLGIAVLMTAVFRVPLAALLQR